MKRQALILSSVVGAVLLGVSYFKFVAAALEGQLALPSMPMFLGGLALFLPGLFMDGVFAVLWKATRRTVTHLPVLFPFLLIYGGLGHVLMWKLGPVFVPWTSTDPQMQFLLWGAGEQVVLLIWCCLTFPFLAAAAIFCWRSHEEGEPTPTFQTAWAFARSKYRRMVGPHAKAFILITLGMIVLIPGVVYGLWFAFVDPITATDDRSKHPLERSRKLTRGRRGRLVRAWLPFAIWSIPVSGIPPYLPKEMEAIGVFAVVAFGVFDVFLMTIMKMAMYGFYEQRIDDALARRAELSPSNEYADDGSDTSAGSADAPASSDS